MPNTSIQSNSSRVEELEQEVMRLRAELKLAQSATGYESKASPLETKVAVAPEASLRKYLAPSESSLYSDASTLSCGSSDLQLSNLNSRSDSTNVVPQRRNKSSRICVESCILAPVPQSMQIAHSYLPCCIFTVLDGDRGLMKWRFIKTLDQLKGFHYRIKEILRTKLRSGEIRLSTFPHKSLFNTFTPWKVDVRRDLLSSYFLSINRIYDFLMNNDKALFDKVHSALNDLWLSDNVKLHAADPKSTGAVNGSGGEIEKRGYLLMRTNALPKWICCYCVLNGCFLDIVCNRTNGSVTKSVDLRKARVYDVMVFFDATDDDERYVFHIEEWTEKGTKCHALTAESDEVKQNWMKTLKAKIISCSNATSTPREGWRIYDPENLPMPYQLIIDPKRSGYLSQHDKAGLSNINSGAANATASNKYNQLSDGPPTGRPRGLAHTHDDHFAEVDSIESASIKNYQGFDGGEYYMKISKPIDCQKLDDGANLDSQNVNYTKIPEAYAPTGRIHQTPAKVSNPANEPRAGCGNPSSVQACCPSSPTRAISKTPSMRRSANGKQCQMFGVMPNKCQAMITLSTGDQVPSVVARCVRQLDHPAALSEVGIFRISGTQKLIDELEEEFESKGDANLAKSKIDIHTIADLLKRYLRSLPESLFGAWSGEKTMTVMHLSESEKIKVLRLQLANMEPLNRSTVRTILRLLHNIIQKESSNKMSVVNLSQALNTALGIPINILVLFIKYQKDILI